MHTKRYIIRINYLAYRKKFCGQNGVIPRPIPNIPLETVETDRFCSGTATPSLQA